MKNVFVWISWIVLIKQTCSMESCYCIPQYKNYIKSTLIDCYDNNGMYKYKIDYDFKSISVECMGNTDNASNDYYEDLPEINMPNTVDRIIFTSCPLIQMPLINIAKKMNPNMQLSSMSIRGSAINENDTLENYHLKGINGLIELEIQGFTKFSNDILMDLTKLTSFSLINVRLILQKEFLYSNTKLVNLTLENNGLKSLPEDFFKIPNSSLEYIDLSMNSLIYLETNTFEYLYSLKRLFLENNKLELLHPDTFYNNTNLEILNLSGNHFKNIPGDIFRNNFKLKSISISHNKQYIERLSNGLFKNMKNLKRLELDDSKIESLPNDLLWGSEGIINISMEKNELVKIPDDLFKDQKDLFYLNLMHNKINETLKEQFKQLKRLKELNLDFNHLTLFYGDTLNENSQLEILTISHNELEVFYNLSRLKTIVNVDLSFNKLTFFNNHSEPFFSHNMDPNIRYLNLSHNNLTTLKITDLKSLGTNVTIDLTNNIITRMIFTNEPDKEIQKGIRVLIENNPINCDCDFYKFKRILNLESGHTTCAYPPTHKGIPLSDLKDEFCLFEENCPRHCKCEKQQLDKSLRLFCSSDIELPLTELKTEDDYNYTEFHFDENSLKNIASIRLRNNQIFSNIKKLFLSGNQISEILSTDIPDKIEVFDLGNNHLVHVQPSVVDILNNSKTLKKINFLGNPIKCDCSNFHFLTFLNFKKGLVDNYKNMTCSNGEKIFRKNLDDLCYNMNTVIIALLIFATAIIISLIYYKYKFEIIFYIYNTGLFSCFFRQYNPDKNKMYDAFISYCHADQEFVEEILNYLEKGSHPSQICVHYRDWLVGEDINAQITRSVRDSKHTIIVLSANYIKSSWSRVEFRAAQSRPLKEGGRKIILILHGDFEPTNILDPEIKSYLRTNTYIKSDDIQFLPKLKYAISGPIRKI